MRVRSEAQTVSMDEANSENMDILAPADRDDTTPTNSSFQVNPIIAITSGNTLP